MESTSRSKSTTKRTKKSTNIIPVTNIIPKRVVPPGHPKFDEWQNQLKASKSNDDLNQTVRESSNKLSASSLNSNPDDSSEVTTTTIEKTANLNHNIIFEDSNDFINSTNFGSGFSQKRRTTNVVNKSQAKSSSKQDRRKTMLFQPMDSIIPNRTFPPGHPKFDEWRNGLNSTRSSSQDSSQTNRMANTTRLNLSSSSIDSEVTSLNDRSQHNETMTLNRMKELQELISTPEMVRSMQRIRARLNKMDNDQSENTNLKVLESSNLNGDKQSEIEYLKKFIMDRTIPLIEAFEVVDLYERMETLLNIKRTFSRDV
ncbi:hypothetical protein RDWZM_008618 [Blomia tropicalis]|uniref:Uncharacterized protein n=1 Tax=Blomia tropicalis TaxID=40697 RepID=A0A9Q0RK94_BLOTA|nr:hypothetical protein RDWZM_008618 [Blomia tropicalis]